jgi:hypothetical protein
VGFRKVLYAGLANLTWMCMGIFKRLEVLEDKIKEQPESKSGNQGDIYGKLNDVQ